MGLRTWMLPLKSLLRVWRTKSRVRIELLHAAVNRGDIAVLEDLLEKASPAALNVWDSHGETVLHMAVEQDDPDMVASLLLSGAKPNLKARDSTLPADRAQSDSM